MKLMDRIKKHLARPEAAPTAGDTPLMARAFQDVAAASDRRKSMRARRDAVREELRRALLQLEVDRNDDDADLAREAQAVLRGETYTPGINLRQRIEQLRREVRVLDRAAGDAKAEYDEVRRARSLEVCAIALPEYREILREGAWHLAHAADFMERARLLRENLVAGGVELTEQLGDLAFPPITRFGWRDDTYPLKQWLDALRRRGVLEAGEDPRDIRPTRDIETPPANVSPTRAPALSSTLEDSAASPAPPPPPAATAAPSAPAAQVPAAIELDFGDDQRSISLEEAGAILGADVIAEVLDLDRAADGARPALVN